MVVATKNFGGFNIIRGVCIESVSHSLEGCESVKLPHKYAHALGSVLPVTRPHHVEIITLTLDRQQFPDD